MTTSIRHDPFPVAKPYHGIYAHGVETHTSSRQLYVSGQVGVAPDGGLANNFGDQCRQAIQNVFNVLDSANMQARDIVKMNFYLTRREDMGELIQIRKDLLEGVRPAITTIFVASLVSEAWYIEVEAFAACQDNQSEISKL